MRSILPRLYLALAIASSGLSFARTASAQQLSLPAPPAASPSVLSLAQKPTEQLLPPAQKPTRELFSLDLPRPEQLFRVQSEESSRKEIESQAMQQGVKKVQFPQDAHPIAVAVDSAQSYPPLVLDVLPEVVCFRTLYFQDVSRERETKSWCVGEPLREAFLFYGEALILPGMMVLSPPCRYHCWQHPFDP